MAPEHHSLVASVDPNLADVVLLLLLLLVLVAPLVCLFGGADNTNTHTLSELVAGLFPNNKQCGRPSQDNVMNAAVVGMDVTDSGNSDGNSRKCIG
jgi:hypothetical protein